MPTKFAELTSIRSSGTSRCESILLEYDALRKASCLRETIVSFCGYRQSFINNEVADVKQLPFLNVETSKNRKKMSKVIDQAENVFREDPSTYWERDNDQYDFDTDHELEESPDECLIRAYLKTPKSLHVRRTLDQFHYSMLPSTEERDVDQFLLKHSSDQTRPKVVMVDQLWIWMFDGMSPSKNFEFLMRRTRYHLLTS